jgi:RNA polymerase subunit RPABC4/transcription elongation factor Spt4
VLDLLGTGWLESLRLLGTLVFAYLLLLWVATVLWAFRDIRSRTLDPISQVIGIAVVALMPFFGLAIYLIVRPSETLAEAYERELEQEAIRTELMANAPCPNCNRPVERDFILCAYCRTPVREECTRCRKLLSLDWRNCPYCGTARLARPEPVRATGRAAEREEAPERVQNAGRIRNAGAEPVAPRPRATEE